MWGSIISAGASLLGGLMSKDSNENMAEQNIAMQKEFAQNGVRWKVEDAKAAGIHPLYALGSNTHSFSPVSVDDSMGASVANAGQDIGRAIDSSRTSPERDQAQKLGALQLERAGLENELIRSQIANSKASILRHAPTPAMPTGSSGLNMIDGQGNVVVEPSQVTTGAVGTPGRQPGQITEYQFTAPDKSGSVGLVPSEQMKNRIDDDFVASTMWHLQNRLLAPRHPDSNLYWNPLVQRYVKNPIPPKYRFIK